MSLKDRFNSSQKTQMPAKDNEQTNPKQIEPAYPVDSLGPIDSILMDDDVNSIFLNGAKQVYIERKGKVHKSTSTFRDAIQLENLIRKIAQDSGIKLDEYCPFMKFNHKRGINVSASLPPLSNTPYMYIKCYKEKFATLEMLQENLSISKEIALVLEILCALKKNIIIAGDKSTLKTTLLSALAKELPINNKEIVIDCEQEFSIDNPSCTTFNFSLTSDFRTKSQVMESILRSHPDKIVVNDNEGDTLEKFLEYAHDGYRGLIASINATNTNDAINKLAYKIYETMPYLDFNYCIEYIKNAIDIIIFVSKAQDGSRLVTSVTELTKDNIDEIFSINDKKEHLSTGRVPSFYNEAKLYSIPLNANIFEKDYSHTYHQNKAVNTINNFTKKSANPQILKKFKKDTAAQEDKKEEKKEDENQNFILDVQPQIFNNSGQIEQKPVKENEITKIFDEKDKKISNFLQELELSQTNVDEEQEKLENCIEEIELQEEPENNE